MNEFDTDDESGDECVGLPNTYASFRFENIDLQLNNNEIGTNKSLDGGAGSDGSDGSDGVGSDGGRGVGGRFDTGVCYYITSTIGFNWVPLLTIVPLMIKFYM